MNKKQHNVSDKTVQNDYYQMKNENDQFSIFIL